jgi:hypothetical protein
MKYYLLKTIPKRLLSYSSIEETNQLIFEIYELIGKTRINQKNRRKYSQYVNGL